VLPFTLSLPAGESFLDDRADGAGSAYRRRRVFREHGLLQDFFPAMEWWRIDSLDSPFAMGASRRRPRLAPPTAPAASRHHILRVSTDDRSLTAFLRIWKTRKIYAQSTQRVLPCSTTGDFAGPTSTRAAGGINGCSRQKPHAAELYDLNRRRLVLQFRSLGSRRPSRPGKNKPIATRPICRLETASCVWFEIDDFDSATARVNRLERTLFTATS